jgi:uncharacterized protein YoaH (UPF0181 family)
VARRLRETKKGTEVSANFEKLVKVVEETRADMEKAETGNRSAGVRVRKSMQEIKQLAQEIRKEMMGAKKAEPQAQTQTE